MLELGNLDIERDWGYAPDYVMGMWMMLQQETPSDYVLATGTTHKLSEFIRIAFQFFDLDYQKYIHTNKSSFDLMNQKSFVGILLKLEIFLDGNHPLGLLKLFMRCVRSTHKPKSYAIY